MMVENKKGISMINLIIVVVIIIILVWTVIKVVLGQGSVLFKAQSAGEESRISSVKEQLSNIINNYKTDKAETYATGGKVKFEDFLLKEKGQNIIQEYWLNSNYGVIKIKEYYFFINEENENWKVLGNVFIEDDSKVPELFEMYNLSIKEKNKTKDVEFETGKVYLITSETKNEYYNYKVKDGANATVILVGDLKINNKLKDDAAISLGNKSNLNLYVYGNSEVSSLYNGNKSIVEDEISSKGGYAGIYDPAGSSLNIYGSGSLSVYGGAAKKGGTFNSENMEEGNGGGGAGAGIGGNGGDGGAASITQGIQGGVGGSCGDVTINGKIVVNAKGGAGASGGDSNQNGSGAGGGYPAAGIGGGGAGGGGATQKIGGGGYSGGAAIAVDEEKIDGGKDGLPGGHTQNNSKSEYYYFGGGYLKGTEGIDKKKNNREELCLGGFNSVSNDGTIVGSTGGIAGAGGNIVINDSADLKAVNGNRFSKTENGNEPLQITNQGGKNREQYVYKTIENGSFILDRKVKSKKIKTTEFGSGIGSGAGYIESSNGTFKDRR